jgi:integrase
MMSVHIRVRVRKTGKRYQVRYRIGGRDDHPMDAGTFETMREAKIRRDLVAGWLAAAKDPKVELERYKAQARPTRSLATVAAALLESRVDVTPATIRSYNDAFKHILARFGSRDPRSITHNEVQEFVNDLAGRSKPATVRAYMNRFRMLLDYADVDPNPTRDKRVRLPRLSQDEPVPPTAGHFLAILENIREPLRLPLVVMEQTAMRTGEVASLTWQDVDLQGCQFRLRASETKSSRSRWVQVPDWLMALVAAGTPYDDRAAGPRWAGRARPPASRTTTPMICATAAFRCGMGRGSRRRNSQHGRGIRGRR